jgi:hypothetical protein
MVSTALSACRIPHLTFRYGAADQTWKEFDPAMSDVEFDQFQKCGTVMNDDEARDFIKSGKKVTCKN